jgi:pimeloyl-[acyl-carrier protein] synthase
MNSLPIWNPFKNNYSAESLEILKNIREKNPIHRAIGGNWIFSKYEDVKRILIDENFETLDLKNIVAEKGEFRKDNGDFKAIYENTASWFIVMNKPEHTELRKVVASFWNDFKLENLINKIVDDSLASLSTNNDIDFSAVFSIPISVKTICHILGLSENDKEYLLEVSHNLLKIAMPFSSIYSYIEQNEFVSEISPYFDKIIKDKQNNPDQSLISKLVHESECTEKEIKSVALLLIFTGLESSTYFMNTAFYYLLKNIKEWELLKKDTKNIQLAVEELLRYTAITKCIYRKAKQAIDISGVNINKGEVIVVSVESANHDEAIFENSMELNLNRKPNPHLAFGYGFHTCLGAKLARMQGRILFKKLAESGIEFEIIDKVPDWRKNVLIGGLNSLNLKITRHN